MSRDAWTSTIRVQGRQFPARDADLGAAATDDHGDVWVCDRSAEGPGVRVWKVVNSATVKAPDLVNHSPHYSGNPEGIECIQVTRHMNFNRGNAVKYIWRAGAKGSHADGIADLRKARWYITDELRRLGIGEDGL